MKEKYESLLTYYGITRKIKQHYFKNGAIFLVQLEGMNLYGILVFKDFILYKSLIQNGSNNLNINKKVLKYLRKQYKMEYDNWRNNMEEVTNEKIILNGKEMTKEEFENEKKKLTEQKIQIVEVGNNSYKTRLQD